MWPPKSSSYSPIHSSDESQETLTPEKYNDGPLPERSRWKSVLQSKAFRISLALSTSLLLILLTFSIFNSKTEHHDCGRSPAEAVSKNCHFDLLAFAWVPIPCFDAELSSTYDAYHDFNFFYDRNRTHQIPVEELEKGINPRVYTSGEYHRTHCTYAWQTLQRAVLKGYGLSDNKTLNAGHYDHCSYYLVNVDHKYRARFHMDYLHCERIGRGG